MVAGALLLLAIWLYGAIHVVYGKGLGVTTCWKVGWSFSDTFIDVERISDAEAETLMEPKVLAAVDKCRIVPDKDAWDRDRVIMVIGVLAAIPLLMWAWQSRRKPPQ